MLNNNFTEGPMTHDQPTYASVPGIRVYGMMCVKPTPAYNSGKETLIHQTSSTLLDLANEDERRETKNLIKPWLEQFPRLQLFEDSTNIIYNQTAY